MNDNCVFCKSVAKTAPATIVREWYDAVAITPLKPCTPGHILIIPKKHVRDALSNPLITEIAARRASELADGDCNLIMNVGREAGQTVFHLHLHIVPRRAGDGLRLPWSP